MASDTFRSLDLDEIRHKQEVRDTDEELKQAAATSTPTTDSSETLLPEPLAFLESVAPVETAVSDSPTVQADDTPPDESSIDPSDSRHAARLFLEGERHHKRHNLECAEELYTQAVRIDPRFDSATARRGQIRLADGEIEEALSDFNRSIQLDKTAVEAFWWRGDVHALAGDLDAAIGDYTRALSSATGPRSSAFPISPSRSAKKARQGGL
ncbi:MAG: tetratricopeptide repeat protein [Gemmataceae bacterium]